MLKTSQPLDDSNFFWETFELSFETESDFQFDYFGEGANFSKKGRVLELSCSHSPSDVRRLEADGPEKNMKIIRLDIKKRQASEMPLILPTLKKNKSRTLVTVNTYGILYLLETHNDESIIESKYYLDDGKK